MRRDHQLISQWIQPNSKVLDLGCGQGELLSGLKAKKNTVGYGLEINPENITACIIKGVNVVEQDLDTGLANFKDQAFNSVVMTQALQAVKQPDVLLDEMLRIGKEAIITFPNFGHWRTRAYLGFKGRMPISKTLPYTWYNTPNIHLCTFKDFEALCFRKGLTIVKRTVVDQKHYDHWWIRLWPNLLGEIAIYRVSK